MALTDVALRKLKSSDRPRKVADARGLYVLVTPQGSKLWRLKYRVSGKEKLLALGTYPDIGLSDAREAAAAARKVIAGGSDPAAQKKQNKLRRKAEVDNTFRAVASTWLAKEKASMAPATYAKTTWVLESYTYPKLGALPITQIKPIDVLAVLKILEADGKLETAKRLRSVASRIFRYAIPLGIVESDPCRDLQGLIQTRKTKHYAALTEPAELAALLQAIDRGKHSPIVDAALRLSALLFVRPGELRHAEWHQFELDGDNPCWRYVTAKTGTPHIVPLCHQAVAVLKALQPLTDRKSELKEGLPRYVFPSRASRSKPMSENTVNVALRRLGFSGDQMTAHGFRATARTLLAEMGWRPDAIERQLAHKQSGPLGAAYDRAQFLQERRAMMQAWADYLDQLKSGNTKVVPIRSVAA